MRIRRSSAPAFALALALILGAPGCGSSESTTTSDSGKDSTRRPPARKGPVPSSLGTVESGAEDTIDFAHAGDRARVVETTRRLRRAARGRAARDLRAAGVPEAQIQALVMRARLLQGIAGRADLARVSLAANGVSALMPELYAHFRDPIPPDVLELDYLDREVQLRSIAGDEAAVPRAVKALAATWTGLRRRVITAGGRRVAARFSRHVAGMRRLARGSDRESLQDEAARGLELVDALERQFAG
jgi:hypothetical protein